MSDRLPRKEAQTIHERRTIEDFLGWMRVRGRAVGEPVYGDAPDARVSIDDLPTAIELACGYADDDVGQLWLQTRELVNERMSSSGGVEVERQRIVIGGRLDALIASLQRTMERHCQGRYGRSYLILDGSHDALGENAALTDLTSRLRVPIGCGFTGMYLVQPAFTTPRGFIHFAGAE